MAMIHGSEAQKDVMRQNYGKYGKIEQKTKFLVFFLFELSIAYLTQDSSCVTKVKEVYNDLHLRDMFYDFKKRNQREVMQQINQTIQSNETLRNACLNVLNYAYYH